MVAISYSGHLSKKKFVNYSKFKLNWASCIICDNPNSTQPPHGMLRSYGALSTAIHLFTITYRTPTRDANSFSAPKSKEVYEVQFRGHFQSWFGLFTSGTLIKSYITRKPPIAPNLKQLSQLLLPAIFMVEISGGDCARDEEGTIKEQV